ncbi:MAG: flavin reductase family protein [Rickettsiales bacterium]
MSKFATGVTVVTTKISGEQIGVTINSFASLSLKPKLIMFSLKKGSFCYDHFVATKEFACNILSESQKQISNIFTKKIGSDQWEDVELLQNHSLPCLKNSIAYILCKTDKIIDAGDHSIFIGKVTLIDFLNAQNSPLIYFNRQYKAFKDGNL